jgi:heme exporter protein C
MLLKFGLGILMSLAIIIGFLYPPPLPGQDWAEASRIFYYHVPMALVSFLAFAHSMALSVQYLRKRTAISDHRAALAAELGLVFCFMAMVTGSIFAKVAWGTFWNWDPRETSILVLLVIYGAYFALRNAVPHAERRAAFSAVYSIMAFVTVPFFGFIVPRIYESLHPENTLVSEGQINLGGYVAVVFLMSLVSFASIYSWLFSIANRAIGLEQRRLEESYVDRLA